MHYKIRVKIQKIAIKILKFASGWLLTFVIESQLKSYFRNMKQVDVQE